MAQIRQFAARSVHGSQLRRRKYELVRQFGIPENVLGGSLRQTHRRCGRSNCHCAGGRGHPQWLVTLSHKGQRRIERVPNEWVEELRSAAAWTQAYLDALREVMAINLELLNETRGQQKKEAGRVRRRSAR